MSHLSWGIALLVLVAGVLCSEYLAARRRERPKTVADHLKAGDQAAARGEIGDALALYREAIRLDHSSAEAHYKLAFALWERGDLDGAVTELEQCLRWAPDAVAAEYGLGMAYAQRGELERAAEHHRRALEIAPDAQGLREPLAALYWKLGRVDEAKEVLPEFTPLSPEEEERRERVSAQLDDRARAALARWDRAASRIVSVYSVARVGAIAWIAWSVLSLVYELAGGQAKVSPESNPILGVPLALACAAMMAARLALRAMEGYRGRYVRNVMARAGICQSDVEAIAPRDSGPPLWQVELSGMHLALWLATPVMVVGFAQDPVPGWAGWVAGYALFAWVFKFGFWMGIVLVEPERRDAWRTRYRWFGTLKGTLFGLLAVPGIVLGFGALCVGVAELLGH